MCIMAFADANDQESLQKANIEDSDIRIECLHSYSYSVDS